MEDVPQRTLLSPEEQRCEDHFRATHTRSKDGRYTVRLPFRNSPPADLGDSRRAALASLYRLQRNLQLNPNKAAEYAFLQEYEMLGHMTEISNEKELRGGSVYYIPHHAVVRASSDTTRLRVVFNASCRIASGKSLNDHLLVGLKLQIDLSAIILQWRQFRYVYSADIAKMYRQIRVDERDTHYQRILWRDSPSDPVKEYHL